MRIIRLFGLLVILLVFSLSLIAHAATDNNSRSGITVDTNVEINAKPDIAFLVFTFSTDGKDKSQTLQEDTKKTDSVINAIVKSGIPRSCIEPKDTNITAIKDKQVTFGQYGGSPDNATITGYHIWKDISVKVKNFSEINKIVDSAIFAGAAENTIGISFMLSDSERIKQQVLNKAIIKAKTKARAIASALGVKLGKAKYMSGSETYNPRPVQFTTQKETLSIIPNIKVSANVTIDFSIM